MTKNAPRPGTAGPEKSTDDNVAASPLQQMLDNGIAAAMMQSRGLIEESTRILNESRRIAPPKD